MTTTVVASISSKYISLLYDRTARTVWLVGRRTSTVIISMLMFVLGGGIGTWRRSAQVWAAKHVVLIVAAETHTVEFCSWIGFARFLDRGWPTFTPFDT